MSFFKSLMGRDQITPHAPLRRVEPGSTDRGMATPKFSRSANRIVRKEAQRSAGTPPQPAPEPPTTYSISEIMEQWKSEASPEGELFEDTCPPPATTQNVSATPKSAEKPERAKTRLLGFDNVATPSTFEKAKTAVLTSTKFPVGWLVVTDGPGRGESFTLRAGMSQIGRGPDQAVQLDFGDEAISRSNHAAIVYDIENHQFHLGHGGKANIVRLNDTPLITTEAVKSGDTIRIGETSLKLVVFSTPAFNWAGEAADVADT